MVVLTSGSPIISAGSACSIPGDGADENTLGWLDVSLPTPTSGPSGSTGVGLHTGGLT